MPTKLLNTVDAIKPVISMVKEYMSTVSTVFTIWVIFIIDNITVYGILSCFNTTPQEKTVGYVDETVKSIDITGLSMTTGINSERG